MSWDSDTGYNMDKLGNHYVKWSKPDAERQLLYEYTYEGPGIDKFIETK